MKHSPEPWDDDEKHPDPTCVNIGYLNDANGSSVGTFYLDNGRENAARVKACVNALAGVEDPADWVDSMKAMLGSTKREQGEWVCELVEAAKAVFDEDVRAGIADNSKGVMARVDKLRPLAAAIKKFDPEWRGS